MRAAILVVQTAADVVRQYGLLLISVAIGITALSLAYQLYNVVASASKRDLLPSFREALQPENHLAHIITGVVAMRPNSAAKAKVFQVIAAATGIGAMLSTSMFKSVESAVFGVMPHVLGDVLLCSSALQPKGDAAAPVRRVYELGVESHSTGSQLLGRVGRRPKSSRSGR